jgi:hypothetical protein
MISPVSREGGTAVIFEEDVAPRADAHVRVAIALVKGEEGVGGVVGEEEVEKVLEGGGLVPARRRGEGTKSQMGQDRFSSGVYHRVVVFVWVLNVVFGDVLCVFCGGAAGHAV